MSGADSPATAAAERRAGDPGASEARLAAGTASVDITPVPGLALAGWNSDRHGTTVHRPLLCRAMVLTGAGRTAAIVTLDLLGLAADYATELRREVAATLGVGQEQVLICCSHTHSGPMTPGWWLPGIDRPDEPYLAGLRRRVAEAVAHAAASQAPVSVSHGRSCCDLGVSRRLPWDGGRVGYPPRADPAGAVDREVSVLRFDGENGQPSAFLFSYGCHPTVAGPSEWIGPDYPGAAREVIEASFEGATALFLLGNAGDVRTNYTHPDGRFRWDTTMELVDEAGERVGSAAVEAARRARPLPPVLGLGSAERELFCTDDSLACVCGFSTISFGGAALVTNPAETFCEIGLQVRQQSTVPLVFASLTNGMLGYVPTREAYRFGGYEVDVSYRSFGLPAAVRPDSHARFVEGMLESLERAEVMSR